MAAMQEPLDRPQPPLDREVAALGEDQHRVAAAQVAAHGGDLDLRVATARVDEPVRQPPADHVDQRVQRQRLVHHDPRPPAVAAEQVVEDEQRVALAGVDAEHDERPSVRQRGFGALGPVDRHAHARDPQRRPRDGADEPAQNRVVGTVPAVRARRPTAPSRRRPPRRDRSRRRARGSVREAPPPPKSGESSAASAVRTGAAAISASSAARMSGAIEDATDEGRRGRASETRPRYATDAACARSMLSATSGETR